MGTNSRVAGSDDMLAFQALSPGEKWRVSRCLARGEAPKDPQLAAAAVELAERYQRQGRVVIALARWLPVAVVVGAAAVAILSAANGDMLTAISATLVALVNIAHLLFSPMTRPQNVARSLEASRRVSVAGS